MKKRNEINNNLMKTDRYFIPLLLLLFTDLVVLVSTFCLAYLIRFYTPLYVWYPPPLPPYIPDFGNYFLLSLTIGGIGIIIFERFGFYQRRVGLDRYAHPASMVLAILVTYVFIMALLFNYRGVSYSRMTVGLAVILSCGGIVFVHYLLRCAHQLMIDRGIVFLRTVLVGPEWCCVEIESKLQEHHGSQYQIIGYVDTEENTSVDSSIPRLGSKEQLSSILQNEPVDNVIVAMPPKDHQEILQVIDTCRERKIAYRVIPDLYDHLLRCLKMEEIDELPLIVFGETPLHGAGLYAKRLMDVLIASVALMISSPFMLLIAILIKWDTKGKVFYVQERISLDGRKFKMYKFRSMVEDAELNTGPTWAKSLDPRTTYVGRFIRKYNLDEFPQFLNVLRGDMSLVGPRPERPYFVDKFKGEIPYYMRRHIVKSGISGWAQVHGWRGDTSLEERTKHDLYYVENWSLLLDLKIIWKTFTSFKNAY